MAALRKLVWIEHDRFRGWGCSECAWVFSPSDVLTGKSLGEMKQIFELQREKSLHLMFAPSTREPRARSAEHLEAIPLPLPVRMCSVVGIHHAGH
jgi:hypothetical protein